MDGGGTGRAGTRDDQFLGILVRALREGDAGSGGAVPELQGPGLPDLGVYSDDSDMEAVESTLETAGTTYPILAYCADFDPYQTGYVPTTIFLDSQGQLVGETVVGSKSYEEWAAIVEGLL